MASSTLEFSFPRSFLVKAYQKRYSAPSIEYSASYLTPNFSLKRCAVKTINEDRLSKESRLTIPDESCSQSKEGKIVFDLEKLAVDITNPGIRINLHGIGDQPLRTDSLGQLYEDEDPPTIENINFTLPYSCVTKIVKNRGGSVYRSEAWYMGQSGVVLPCMLNTTEDTTDDKENRVILVFEGLILSNEVSPLSLKFAAVSADQPKEKPTVPDVSTSLPVNVSEDYAVSYPCTTGYTQQIITNETVHLPVICVPQSCQSSIPIVSPPIVSVSQNPVMTIINSSTGLQRMSSNVDTINSETDESYRSLVHIEEIIAKDFSPKEDDSDINDCLPKLRQRDASPDLLGKIIEETILKDSDSESSLDRILQGNPFGSSNLDSTISHGNSVNKYCDRTINNISIPIGFDHNGSPITNVLNCNLGQNVQFSQNQNIVTNYGDNCQVISYIHQDGMEVSGKTVVQSCEQHTLSDGDDIMEICAAEGISICDSQIISSKLAAAEDVGTQDSKKKRDRGQSLRSKKRKSTKPNIDKTDKVSENPQIETADSLSSDIIQMCHSRLDDLTEGPLEKSVHGEGKTFNYTKIHGADNEVPVHQQSVKINSQRLKKTSKQLTQNETLETEDDKIADILGWTSKRSGCPIRREKSRSKSSKKRDKVKPTSVNITNNTVQDVLCKQKLNFQAQEDSSDNEPLSTLLSQAMKEVDVPKTTNDESTTNDEHFTDELAQDGAESNIKENQTDHDEQDSSTSKFMDTLKDGDMSQPNSRHSRQGKKRLLKRMGNSSQIEGESKPADSYAEFNMEERRKSPRGQSPKSGSQKIMETVNSSQEDQSNYPEIVNSTISQSGRKQKRSQRKGILAPKYDIDPNTNSGPDCVDQESLPVNNSSFVSARGRSPKSRQKKGKASNAVVDQNSSKGDGSINLSEDHGSSTILSSVELEDERDSPGLGQKTLNTKSRPKRGSNTVSELNLVNNVIAHVDTIVDEVPTEIDLIDQQTAKSLEDPAHCLEQETPVVDIMHAGCNSTMRGRKGKKQRMGKLAKTLIEMSESHKDATVDEARIEKTAEKVTEIALCHKHETDDPNQREIKTDVDHAAHSRRSARPKRQASIKTTPQECTDTHSNAAVNPEFTLLENMEHEVETSVDHMRQSRSRSKKNRRLATKTTTQESNDVDTAINPKNVQAENPEHISDQINVLPEEAGNATNVAGERKETFDSHKEKIETAVDCSRPSRGRHPRKKSQKSKETPSEELKDTNPTVNQEDTSLEIPEHISDEVPIGESFDVQSTICHNRHETQNSLRKIIETTIEHARRSKKINKKFKKKTAQELKEADTIENLENDVAKESELVSGHINEELVNVPNSINNDSSEDCNRRSIQIGETAVADAEFHLVHQGSADTTTTSSDGLQTTEMKETENAVDVQHEETGNNYLGQEDYVKQGQPRKGGRFKKQKGKARKQTRSSKSADRVMTVDIPDETDGQNPCVETKKNEDSSLRNDDPEDQPGETIQPTTEEAAPMPSRKGRRCKKQESKARRQKRYSKSADGLEETDGVITVDVPDEQNPCVETEKNEEFSLRNDNPGDQPGETNQPTTEESAEFNQGSADTQTTSSDGLQTTEMKEIENAVDVQNEEEPGNSNLGQERSVKQGQPRRGGRFKKQKGKARKQTRLSKSADRVMTVDIPDETDGQNPCVETEKSGDSSPRNDNPEDQPRETNQPTTEESAPIPSRKRRSCKKQESKARTQKRYSKSADDLEETDGMITVDVPDEQNPCVETEKNEEFSPRNDNPDDQPGETNQPTTKESAEFNQGSADTQTTSSDGLQTTEMIEIENLGHERSVKQGQSRKGGRFKKQKGKARKQTRSSKSADRVMTVDIPDETDGQNPCVDIKKNEDSSPKNDNPEDQPGETNQPTTEEATPIPSRKGRRCKKQESKARRQKRYSKSADGLVETDGVITVVVPDEQNHCVETEKNEEFSPRNDNPGDQPGETNQPTTEESTEFNQGSADSPTTSSDGLQTTEMKEIENAVDVQNEEEPGNSNLGQESSVKQGQPRRGGRFKKQKGKARKQTRSSKSADRVMTVDIPDETDKQNPCVETEKNEDSSQRNDNPEDQPGETNQPTTEESTEFNQGSADTPTTSSDGLQTTGMKEIENAVDVQNEEEPGNSYFGQERSVKQGQPRRGGRFKKQKGKAGKQTRSSKSADRVMTVDIPDETDGQNPCVDIKKNEDSSPRNDNPEDQPRETNQPTTEESAPIPSRKGRRCNKQETKARTQKRSSKSADHLKETDIVITVDVPDEQNPCVETEKNEDSSPRNDNPEDQPRETNQPTTEESAPIPSRKGRRCNKQETKARTQKRSSKSADHLKETDIVITVDVPDEQNPCVETEKNEDSSPRDDNAEDQPKETSIPTTGESALISSSSNMDGKDNEDLIQGTEPEREKLPLEHHGLSPGRKSNRKKTKNPKVDDDTEKNKEPENVLYEDDKDLLDPKPCETIETIHNPKLTKQNTDHRAGRRTLRNRESISIQEKKDKHPVLEETTIESVTVDEGTNDVNRTDISDMSSGKTIEDCDEVEHNRQTRGRRKTNTEQRKPFKKRRRSLTKPEGLVDESVKETESLSEEIVTTETPEQTDGVSRLNKKSEESVPDLADKQLDPSGKEASLIMDSETGPTEDDVALISITGDETCPKIDDQPDEEDNNKRTPEDDFDLSNIVESIRKSLSEDTNPFALDSSSLTSGAKKTAQRVTQLTEKASSLPAEKFDPEWKKTFSWIYYDDENNVILCRPCLLSKKKNIYTAGSQYFSIDPLTSHTESDDHTGARESKGDVSEDSTEWQQALEDWRDNQTCKKKGFTFNYSWLKEFTWMTYDEGGNKMFCKPCREHNQESRFQQGTSRFVRSWIAKHEDSKSHLTALQLEKEAHEAAKERETKETETDFFDHDIDGAENEPLCWNRIASPDDQSETAGQLSSNLFGSNPYATLWSSQNPNTGNMWPVVMLEDVSNKLNIESGIFNIRKWNGKTIKRKDKIARKNTDDMENDAVKETSKSQESEVEVVRKNPDWLESVEKQRKDKEIEAKTVIKDPDWLKNASVDVPASVSDDDSSVDIPLDVYLDKLIESDPETNKKTEKARKKDTNSAEDDEESDREVKKSSQKRREKLKSRSRKIESESEGSKSGYVDSEKKRGRKKRTRHQNNEKQSQDHETSEDDETADTKSSRRGRDRGKFRSRSKSRDMSESQDDGSEKEMKKKKLRDKESENHKRRGRPRKKQEAGDHQASEDDGTADMKSSRRGRYRNKFRSRSKSSEMSDSEDNRSEKDEKEIKEKNVRDGESENHKRRGRPRKKQEAEDDETSEDDETADTKSSRRGRYRNTFRSRSKSTNMSCSEDDGSKELKKRKLRDSESVPHKRHGRPRKQQEKEDTQDHETSEDNTVNSDRKSSRRGRHKHKFRSRSKSTNMSDSANDGSEKELKKKKLQDRESDSLEKSGRLRKKQEKENTQDHETSEDDETADTKSSRRWRHRGKFRSRSKSANLSGSEDDGSKELKKKRLRYGESDTHIRRGSPRKQQDHERSEDDTVNSRSSKGRHRHKFRSRSKSRHMSGSEENGSEKDEKGDRESEKHKKRGRPELNTKDESETGENDDAPKRRGRPKKQTRSQDDDGELDETEAKSNPTHDTDTPTAKRRGRPKKRTTSPKEDESENEDNNKISKKSKERLIDSEDEIPLPKRSMNTSTPSRKKQTAEEIFAESAESIASEDSSLSRTDRQKEDGSRKDKRKNAKKRVSESADIVSVETDEDLPKSKRRDRSRRTINSITKDHDASESDEDTNLKPKKAKKSKMPSFALADSDEADSVPDKKDTNQKVTDWTGMADYSSDSDCVETIQVPFLQESSPTSKPISTPRKSFEEHFLTFVSRETSKGNIESDTDDTIIEGGETNHKLRVDNDPKHLLKKYLRTSQLDASPATWLPTIVLKDVGSVPYKILSKYSKEPTDKRDSSKILKADTCIQENSEPKEIISEALEQVSKDDDVSFTNIQNTPEEVTDHSKAGETDDEITQEKTDDITENISVSEKDAEENCRTKPDAKKRGRPRNNSSQSNDTLSLTDISESQPRERKEKDKSGYKPGPKSRGRLRKDKSADVTKPENNTKIVDYCDFIKESLESKEGEKTQQSEKDNCSDVDLNKETEDIKDSLDVAEDKGGHNEDAVAAVDPKDEICEMTEHPSRSTERKKRKHSESEESDDDTIPLRKRHDQAKKDRKNSPGDKKEPTTVKSRSRNKERSPSRESGIETNKEMDGAPKKKNKDLSSTKKEESMDNPVATSTLNKKCGNRDEQDGNEDQDNDQTIGDTEESFWGKEFKKGGKTRQKNSWSGDIVEDSKSDCRRSGRNRSAEKEAKPDRRHSERKRKSNNDIQSDTDDDSLFGEKSKKKKTINEHSDNESLPPVHKVNDDLDSDDNDLGGMYPSDSDSDDSDLPEVCSFVSTPITEYTKHKMSSADETSPKDNKIKSYETSSKDNNLKSDEVSSISKVPKSSQDKESDTDWTKGSDVTEQDSTTDILSSKVKVRKKKYRGVRQQIKDDFKNSTSDTEDQCRTLLGKSSNISDLSDYDGSVFGVPVRGSKGTIGKKGRKSRRVSDSSNVDSDQIRIVTESSDVEGDSESPGVSRGRPPGVKVTESDIANTTTDSDCGAFNRSSQETNPSDPWAMDLTDMMLCHVVLNRV